MSIAFSADQWRKVRETHRQWWAGELDRPLVPTKLPGRDPGRPRPDVPLLNQDNVHDFSFSADQIIDRIDWELSRYEYLCDAFPCYSPGAFGPGVTAALLGARLDNSSGRVWYFPEKETPIEALHFEFTTESRWCERMCDLYRAAWKRWQGQALLTMIDLGGVLDILATFRPGEQLLMDLYDAPQEVERLIGEISEAWHRYYAFFSRERHAEEVGHCDWSSLYSEKPTYMLQCDFSYMIGPEMFERFVAPELEANSKRLGRAFYHLDGKGQLPHLPRILQIPHIEGVQWVPGAGAPKCGQWPEVYRAIVGAGKKAQVFGDLDILETVMGQVGTGKGLHLYATIKSQEALARDRQAAIRRLEKLGVAFEGVL